MARSYMIHLNELFLKVLSSPVSSSNIVGALMNQSREVVLMN